MSGFDYLGAGRPKQVSNRDMVWRPRAARKKRPMGLARPIGLYLVNAVVCFDPPAEPEAVGVI